ncbi:hypothetical protein CGCSCA2_v009577 [Colletotrichum siamense]|uniref:Nephrocystin 3-like N-terminal domain-containing protein n=1 Tax=Colletotrichum siamense TaxID=690259 RepID=A0A9P5K1K9_COLSI|nr:hypothetical protein CGCSCA2_v009577 [Colletotrichum siamense]
MDPFSLTVGVLGIVAAAQACLKTIKKRVGASAMSSAEIEGMMKTLYEIHGVMGSFKTHLELHDDDEDRLESLQYLMPVMNRSSEALQIVKDYVNSGRTEKAFRGVKFDKQLKLSLKRLDDASEIFSMAVVSNQQLIMMRVNKYLSLMNHTDDLYLDTRAWLASQDDNNINSQLHERNLAARKDGSGGWLLDQANFQSWLMTKENGPQTNIWLRGSPGVGKSFLCSTAIEHVSKNLQEICLYYFYRFDDQPEAGSSPGVGAAALLVDQLLRHFWQRDQRIATLEHGTTPKSEPVSVYLFLDGLDEIKDPHAAVDILTFFETLGEEPSVVHKTWISSRDTNVLMIHLGQWPVVNVDKYGEIDVKDFLTLAVPKLENGVEKSQQVEGLPLDEWVLQKLQEKARSNFLYAKLMVEWLQEDVFTIDEVIDFIKSRVPNNIAEMYKRIFRQYQEDQHKYIRYEAFQMHKSKKFIIADAVCASASEFVVLSSSLEKSGEMSLETWDLGALNAPRCVSRDTVLASKVDFQADAGQCIAFSSSIAKLLHDTKGSDSTTIFGQRTHANFEPITTDVDMRDGIIVVASRNVRKSLRNQPIKKNANGRKATKVSQGLESDSSEMESDDDSDDGYSTCSTDENSAYETCSEGSTERESDESSDEMTRDDLDSDEQSDESSDAPSDEETDEDERDIEPADDEAEARVEERQTPKQRLVVNRHQLQESSLELEADLLKQKQQTRPTYPGMPSRIRDPKDCITANVSVYNITSGQVARMFHYEHDTAVTCMLYHSPPVLHPNKTLFVWPLGGGEVLFADFEEKTYFIRATMPTTKDM